MRLIPLLLVVSVMGCDATDPLLREGTWRPTHAMDANIAAQVTRPSTLVRGVDYLPRDGSVATTAVARYRAGQIKALPDVNTSQIRSTGGDTNSGGAGAGAGAAGQTQ